MHTHTKLFLVLYIVIIRSGSQKRLRSRSQNRERPYRMDRYLLCYHSMLERINIVMLMLLGTTSPVQLIHSAKRNVLHRKADH